MNNLVSLNPSETEWATLKSQAQMAVSSGFLPSSVNTPEKAVIIALKGRELGIPMMQAYSSIHVISGKPSASAELMMALIYKNCPGAIVNYINNDNESCEIEAIRPGGKPALFSFSMSDAKDAGLLSNPTWKKYPRAMLRSRCVSEMARAVFPDAIMGVSYTPEELGAEVTEEGEVLKDVTSEPETKKVKPEVVAEFAAPEKKPLKNHAPNSNTNLLKLVGISTTWGEESVLRLMSELCDLEDPAVMDAEQFNELKDFIKFKQPSDITAIAEIKNEQSA